MPVRMVDGEAVWTSVKLKQLPEKYRMHYANWIPLAEANGTFEADPEMIHRNVYAFLMKTVTVREVRRILSLFIEVGLVKIWTADGKKWGFFPGMEKPGRLPAQSELKKYKHLPPTIPRELYDNSKTSRPWFGLEGLGKEGSGEGAASPTVSNEENMNIKSTIRKLSPIWKEVKGAGAHLPIPDDRFGTLSRFKQLCEQNGELLPEAFKRWATEAGNGQDPYPLNEFVKVAADYLKIVSAPIGLTPLEVSAEEEAQRQRSIELGRQRDREESIATTKPELELPDDGELF